MSARSVRFQHHSCTLETNESVLDGLLRLGVPVSHACKAGVCGSCLMRAVAGSVPARAQAGLKESWKAQGYFLACVCQPEGDLEVTSAASELIVEAEIGSIEYVSGSVLRVRLLCLAPFEFRAGQFVTLRRLDDGLSRSYSIASLPGEGQLEMHVRCIPNGRMSGWLAREARSGVRVGLLGPAGECFYVPGRHEQPMLLVGTGTGLAPLYGIARDALAQGHAGPIHLFHGALRPDGLYLREELARMAEEWRNFEYTPAVLDGGGVEDVVVGAVDQVVLGRFPKLWGWRGFVCGDPALVQSIKKKLFLSGMAMRDIYSDAFLPSAS